MSKKKNTKKDPDNPPVQFVGYPDAQSQFDILNTGHTRPPQSQLRGAKNTKKELPPGSKGQ